MLKESELSQFTGTDGYHRWSVLFPKVVLTDGCKYVADHGGNGGAYWLFDAIASYQPMLQRHTDERLRDMQFWSLKVHADKSAVLSCVPETGEEPAVTQKIGHTDFDLSEIELYVAPTDDGHGGLVYVILLPSEY